MEASALCSIIPKENLFQRKVKIFFFPKFFVGLTGRVESAQCWSSSLALRGFWV